VGPPEPADSAPDAPPPAGGRARIGSAVRDADRPAAPAAAPAAPGPAPVTQATAPVPVATAAPGTAETGAEPSRDELTLAWADQVLPRLSRQAKPVLAAGHWIATDDGVALAVPNEPHRTRSELHRAELESALASHFGRPVPVVFVVEPSTNAGRSRTAAGPSSQPVDPEPEEAVDPAELVDAGPEHDLAPIERLTQAFPGAELLEEG
jgi:DNA polymerase III subunit gamma/tau